MSRPRSTCVLAWEVPSSCASARRLNAACSNPAEGRGERERPRLSKRRTGVKKVCVDEAIDVVRCENYVLGPPAWYWHRRRKVRWEARARRERGTQSACEKVKSERSNRRFPRAAHIVVSLSSAILPPAHPAMLDKVHKEHIR